MGTTWIEFTESQRLQCCGICKLFLAHNTNDIFLKSHGYVWWKMGPLHNNLIVIQSQRICKLAGTDEVSRPSLHWKNTILNCWQTAFGTVHNCFLKPGGTIIAAKYCEEIHTVSEAFCQTAKFVNSSVLLTVLAFTKVSILLQDNGCPRLLRTDVEKQCALGYETLPHPTLLSQLVANWFPSFQAFGSRWENLNQWHDDYGRQRHVTS